ncbi:hypothetical protein M1146_03610, partial [Patescibacteria group bacterium]|nr:hypothetical protein [Patescibacteria group bacterium]
MNNFSLSQVVANSTETTWSQVYSTLNLFITISLKDNNQQIVVSLGKEILEKLQREYFAIDKKNLSSIKKAVENVVKNIDTGIDYSIILSVLINNILYVVIASEGYVV